MQVMHLASRRLLFILAALSAAALLFALAAGSGPADAETLRTLLSGNADPLEVEILLRLRLPRALAAFGTGASLALAGALMQVLLRNPLADPYVLGTSGGAAVAALGAMLLGCAGVVVDVAAFGGALLSTVLVFALARTDGAWSDGRGYRSGGAASRLLLTGIVIASAWSAAAASAAAASHAPYLRRLMLRRPDLLTTPDEGWADRILREAIAVADAIAAAPPPIEEAMALLRRWRSRLHRAESS